MYFDFYNAYFFTKCYVNHLLESFYRDDSNKWSNEVFGEEIMQVSIVEISITHLIWSFDPSVMACLQAYTPYQKFVQPFLQ